MSAPAHTAAVMVDREPRFHTLIEALDSACGPVPFFVRDDDAGWDDAALMRLLDLMRDLALPVDLAVIPKAITRKLAFDLMRRQDCTPARIGLHQHGFAHLNHERVGRKCEFGDARSWSWQRADLLAGREILEALFGDRLDPIFTPPWNRCSAGTPQCLADLGYEALSRCRSAPVQAALPELPVDVDWCRHAREANAAGATDTAERAAAELASRVGAGGPVGLMLHHAAMDPCSLQQLAPLLRVLKTHPHARCQSMREILEHDLDARDVSAAGVEPLSAHTASDLR